MRREQLTLMLRPTNPGGDCLTSLAARRDEFVQQLHQLVGGGTVAY